MSIMSKSLIATCLSLVVASGAQASGTISFTGNVYAQTCTINGGSGNLPVALPGVGASRLINPGDTAGDTPFVLQLTECPTGLVEVSTYFEPGPTISEGGRLKVDPNGSENLEVQLLNSAKEPMNLAAERGSQGSQWVKITGGNATLNYTARYFSLGSTTAGAVATRVQYSLDYL